MLLGALALAVGAVLHQQPAFGACAALLTVVAVPNWVLLNRRRRRTERLAAALADRY
jgi:Flp pilus assembly protein TadB